MKKPLITALLAAAATLAACQTGPERGVEVTRFHLGETIPAQAINVEPADPAEEGSLEFRTYAAIVAEEMVRLGFDQATLPDAEMIAVVEVSRGSRVETARRSPFSIGIGGGSFGRNVGVGVGTSVGIGGSRGGEIAVTQLDVKLKRRSEGTIVWEGRAVRETRPGEEDPATVVRRLAAALFSQFPGESGQTIRVD